MWINRTWPTDGERSESRTAEKPQELACGAFFKVLRKSALAICKLNAIINHPH